MIDTIIKLLKDTLQVTLLVAVMMIAVDLINVFTKQKLESFFKNARKYRQYFFASLIGTVPGCIGGFTNVSLYIHGLISFGGLAGAMIAVSGDEAFVMLAMFPKDAIILFMILFVIGIFSGWLIDIIVKRYNISTCDNCAEMITHPQEKGFKHYIKEHFLSYDAFPWFKQATLEQITTVEWPTPNHLYWPLLDVDLAVESIRNPSQFPLVAKSA